MIKHLKLVGGEEIICDVVEWDDAETGQIIVSMAYRIITVENTQMGYRFYTFRPWMVFIEDPEWTIGLNAHQVVAVTDPHDKLIEQYNNTIAKRLIDEEESEEQPDMVDLAKKFQEMMQSGVSVDGGDSASMSLINGGTLH